MAFAVRALPGDRPCWFGCVRPSYYIPGPPRERVREQGCWHVVGVATQRRGGGEEEKRSGAERRTAIRTRYGAKRERGADRRPTAGHGEADRAREAGKEARRRKATLRFLLLRCSPPASNLYLHRTFLSLPPLPRARVYAVPLRRAILRGLLRVSARASLLRAAVDQQRAFYGVNSVLTRASSPTSHPRGRRC